MKALILVDIQNDFMPGGALAVPDGDAIIEGVNELQGRFDLIVATQDWHPADHGSFAAQHPGKNPGELITLNDLPQMLWPVHCVQGSKGAEFVETLDVSKWARVFTKGTDVGVDSYSGFFDNGHGKATGLATYLRSQHVDTVYVAGVATDYCVKFTALDAASEGFETYLIQDLTRAVNNDAVSLGESFEEMRDAGIHIVEAANV